MRNWAANVNVVCFSPLLAILLLFCGVKTSLAASPKAYGLDSRAVPSAYLSMPHRTQGIIPALLSQTGAFQSVQNLTPVAGLVPYDLIVSFWSDGADKIRFVSVPKEKIKFSPTGEWNFPAGTVFVKTFELSIDESNPKLKRRLETRLLVRDDAGGVYGVTYKWRADNSDADLLTTNLTEMIPVKTATGVRMQPWYYPSRQDCLTCHTPNAGLVLGVKTRQLNRGFTYSSGVSDNELRTWNHLGLFDTNLDETQLQILPALAAFADSNRGLEDRARSYLDANCAQCHRPHGTVAYFDARYDTPLAKQGLIDGPVLIDQRIDKSRVVAPNDVWRSILLLRASSIDGLKMPPLAHNRVDEEGMALLKQWIESLPGPPVVAPPGISPAGGNYGNPITVTMTAEAGAAIHYTMDGSVPGISDPLYEKPLTINGPTILRAKAFKSGCTKSITSQEIYMVTGGAN